MVHRAAASAAAALASNSVSGRPSRARRSAAPHCARRSRVSKGCCSPRTRAASAHTGHHTCWHLPGPSAPPAAAAAARTAGSSRSRMDCANAATPDRDRRELAHDGHTSGFGRNRTVSSLPLSWASVTMHRRRTDASRTRRLIPPTPMIKSSSTRPSASAVESTWGNSSRNRYTASSPEPDSRSTIGRNGPGGGEPSRLSGAFQQFAERLGADRFAREVRNEHQLDVADGGVEFVEHGLLFGDPLGVPVERRMFGQVSVLVRIILHQNLIDDQLTDAHSHQRQRAERARGLGGHHPLRGEHQVRAHPVAVGEQPRQRGVARVDALHQLDDRRGARIVCRRAEPAVARPRPLQVQAEGRRAASACAGHRPSTRSPRRRGPTPPIWPARRPREDREPPEFREAPKVLPGQCLPGQTRRNRAVSTPAMSRHRASSSASVSSASASRNPPPGSPRRRRAPSSAHEARSGTTGVPSTSPSECAWSVDTTSTRRPLCASRTAVAVASVDLPTPPLPTKRLIRA